MSEKNQSDLRLFTLLLTLANQPRGVTKTQLYQLIPAYQQLAEPARERKFERDKATLKELGVELRVVAEARGEPRYFAEFPRDELRLGVAERRALGLAARLWYDAPDWADAHQLFRYKVDANAFTSPSAVRTLVAGGQVAVALLEALNTGRAVSFAYKKLVDAQPQVRRVRPRALVFKDSVLYLEGFDYMREDQRSFRLSRIVPDSLEILEAAPADPPPVGVVGDFAARELTPSLLVAPDYVQQASFWADPDPAGFRGVAGGAGEAAQAGAAGQVPAPLAEWVSFRGRPATFSIWLERLLNAGPQVLVTSSGDLQRAVKALLTTAAAWEGAAHGD